MLRVYPLLRLHRFLRDPSPPSVFERSPAVANFLCFSREEASTYGTKILQHCPVNLNRKT